MNKRYNNNKQNSGPVIVKQVVVGEIENSETVKYVVKQIDTPDAQYIEVRKWYFSQRAENYLPDKGVWLEIGTGMAAGIAEMITKHLSSTPEEVKSNESAS